MKLLTLTSILLVTAFHAVTSACLPPPKAYQDQEVIQAVVNSSAMSQALGEVFSKDYNVGISSISLPIGKQNEVAVSFSNQCVATFKVTWENTDDSIPCGGGYKPTKVTRASLSCE